MYIVPSSVAMNRETNFAPTLHRHNNFYLRGRGSSYRQQFNRWNSNSSRQNQNEKHWCETCERGFSSQELLNNHKQQHQKCNIDGCQFIAHPKVITKHIQMQHSTGLFKKIGNLSNPEEILKWREERKKKYPTKQNVDQKNAETQDKIKRGEKIGLFYKSDRRQKYVGVPDGNQKRKYPFEKKRSFDFKRKVTSNHTYNKKKILRKDLVPPIVDSRKLKPFTGFQYLMLEMSNNESDEVPCSDMIEDDDDSTQELPEVSTKTNQPSVCGALSSLMCDYGSSEDELHNEILQNPKDKDNNSSRLPKSSFKKIRASIKSLVQSDIQMENKKESDDESGPEEVKVQKPVEDQTNKDVQVQPTSSKDIVKKIEKNIKGTQCRNPRVKPKSKLPSTLLEKLLHREIKHERNVILQCVRHIVKNNYFDK